MNHGRIPPTHPPVHVLNPGGGGAVHCKSHSELHCLSSWLKILQNNFTENLWSGQETTKTKTGACPWAATRHPGHGAIPGHTFRWQRPASYNHGSGFSEGIPVLGSVPMSWTHSGEPSSPFRQASHMAAVARSFGPVPLEPDLLRSKKKIKKGMGELVYGFSVEKKIVFIALTCQQ